jgi:hypothetical protein
MTELPYFKFFTADWLGGAIQGADMETQGIFINLCAMAWKNGGAIEASERTARRLHVSSKCLANAIQVLTADGCLIETEGGYSTKFILEQLSERTKLSVIRSAAGSKGGKAKAKQMPSKCQANATCDSDSDSNSDSVSDKEAGFDDFWQAYPRKVGKAAARKAWAKHSCGDKFDAIIAALRAQKQQAAWTKDGGQYVPHASTWLNGERWEDETDAGDEPGPVYVN